MTRFLLVLLLLSALIERPAPAHTPARGRFVLGPLAGRPAAAAQLPGNTSPATPQEPSGNQSPLSPTNATPGAPASLDPATSAFTTDAGMILVTVKPDKTADYEAVIVALQEALSKSEDEEVRKLASGWRVFKAADLDAKANAIYIHFLQPTVTSVDYRPSLWLDKLLSGAPADLLAKYRDAFAAPPTKLPLVEFADMSKAPPPKPGNKSPDGPSGNASPGNATPAKPPANGSPAAPVKPGNGPPEASSVPSTPSLPASPSSRSFRS